MTKLERLLLSCGILSSLLRVATDILAAMWYPGYSYIDQTMSQLAAIGAPTRPFQVALLAVWSALVIAFGIGVWGSAGRKRSLRVTGILLAITCFRERDSRSHQSQHEEPASVKLTKREVVPEN